MDGETDIHVIVQYTEYKDPSEKWTICWVYLVKMQR